MLGRRRPRWFVVFEVLLTIGVGYFVWRALRARWHELANQPLTLVLRPGLLIAASVVVLATYSVLIESWRRVLVAWDQRLAWRTAAGIWAVSNLGRYVPGKVWAVAGMALLAERAGVSAWTSMAGAVILQVLSLGTGAAVVAAAAPEAASPVWIALAVGLALATVAAVAWPPAARRLGRVVPGLAPSEPRGARLAPIVSGALATTVAWVSYGLALWLLAQAVLPEPRLGFRAAVGAFAASYLVGLLALFAPGGVVVREGVLFGLLGPSLGAPAALALAVASRLLLTGTELVAALVGWILARRRRERAT